MTEVEWQTSSAPLTMLNAIGRRKCDRKRRLFGCACLHKLERHHMGDYSSILATAERMADGVATPEEVAEAQRVAQVALDQESGARHWLAEVARKTVAPEPVDAAFAFTSANEFLRDVGEPHDNEGHASFLRDIFGNPFIKPQFKKKWRTDIAFALASQMYDSGDFSAMPILADALQDAGCDNDDILNHCRGPGPHVRGCWVVDLVLGRE